MSIDDTLMCSFQILKPTDKRNAFGKTYSANANGRPVTPPSKQ
jgi:hypothetical protein